MRHHRLFLPSILMLVALTSLACAGAARGAIKLGSCPKLSGSDFRCGTLAVPLDYTAQVQGTLNLKVRLLKAPSKRRGTLVMLSGGPGQAGIDDPSYDSFLSDLMPNYDVIELDQRGTGATALRCTRLDGLDIDVQDVTSAQLKQAYAECAASLGPNRRFYSSLDSARDIETLRGQLGLAKIAIGGVSYGTFVSQMYARLFPDKTERMLLDSVVGPKGVQSIYLDSFDASRRVMAAQCSGNRCFGVTTNLAGDVGELQQRLLAQPIKGKVVNSKGRPIGSQLGGPSFPTALFDIFVAGDLNPFLREGYPAAVKAALRGDPSALLRLRKAGGGSEPVNKFSNALFAATTCAEDNFPWQGNQPFDQRQTVTAAAIAALPDSALAPWGRANAAASGELNGCMVWPDSPFVSVPPQSLPDVPTLLLVGRDDTRTPVEDAREVAVQLPHATLVEIPNAGHSTIGNTECTSTAVRRFMANRPVGQPCTKEPRFAYSSGPIPESINDFRASGGAKGRAGRTASATAVSILDAATTAQTFYASNRFPGLRRGYGFVDGGSIELRNYSFVPGVQLTGRVGASNGRLKITGGAAAKGTLVRRKGKFSGRLGGKPVKFGL